jgi:hypothetical protein
MIQRLLSITFAAIIGVSMTSSNGHAQTVGGVFGPNISDGDTSAEYRAAFAPVDGSDDVRFVQRIHYQYAFNDGWRVRGVLQASDIETGNQEFNFFQGEIQWQFLEENKYGVSSAVRLDGRITEGDDGADLVSLNSTTQWNINKNWQTTGVILLGRELGNDSRDGINLETRVSLLRRVSGRVRIGVESFNIWGNSDDGFASIDAQRHSLGPVATLSLGNGWSILGGTLFGVTDAAPETDFRIWVNKSF